MQPACGLAVDDAQWQHPTLQVAMHFVAVIVKTVLQTGVADLVLAINVLHIAVREALVGLISGACSHC